MAERRAVGYVGYTAVAVLVLGGAGWLVLRHTAADGATAAAAPTGTARVTRTDVVVRTLVGGTLGYLDQATLPAVAPGTLTWLPAVGTVVRADQRLYEVDGRPVLLWIGDRPAWRDFVAGMADGPDVAQLERNLVALGFGAGLTVDNHFSTATGAAIRRWQAAHGLPRTGAIALGQVVFRNGPVRIAAVPATLGAPLSPGSPVVMVTSTTTAVTVDLDPVRAGSVHIGDAVGVSPLGSGQGAPSAGVPGRVTVVGVAVAPQAATGGGSAGGGSGNPPAATSTVPVTVGVDDPAGQLTPGPVQVAITDAADRGVLGVLIDALLSAPGGGYQVVVRLDGGRRTVAVRTRLFDESDGLVEVEGLAEGTVVEVPAS
jgi:peptidoglycan hydrolase-like protein with peptidoglycan-binding domain